MGLGRTFQASGDGTLEFSCNDRIGYYADIVGRERVIAGTDCGFATFAAQQNPVVPSVVWAKLKALAEGAAIATDRLWGRAA